MNTKVQVRAVGARGQGAARAAGSGGGGVSCDTTSQHLSLLQGFTLAPQSLSAVLWVQHSRMTGPILQLGKLSSRQVHQLAQSHTGFPVLPSVSLWPGSGGI